MLIFSIFLKNLEIIRAKEQRVRVIAEYCLSSLSSLTTSVFISDTEGLIKIKFNYK